MENSTNFGPDNELYLAYNGVQPCWPFIGLALLFNGVALPGVVMNCAVVWVTIRTKSLRGTANFLLALYSLFEMCNQACNLFFLWTAISPHHFVDYALAVRLCVPHEFGIFGATMALAFTGFDRFAAVFWPLRYHWMKRQAVYLSAISAACTGFGLYAVALYFEAAARKPQRQITGQLGDLVQMDVFSPNVLYAAELLNAITALFYAAVWLRMRFSITPDNQNKELFRALAFIVTFNLAGYLFGVLCIIVLKPYLQSLSSWFIFNLLVGIPTNISAASNGPILYWTSDIYRDAFRREAAKWRKSNVVTTTQVQVIKSQNQARTVNNDN